MTSLYSSWMAPTDAQRKLQTLLADLRKGTSWSNMYKMTAKACEAIQPLPRNFAMPKVAPHPLDKKLARIRWQQRGAIVAQHAKHLQHYNGKVKKVQVASQHVVVAATCGKHEALVLLLQNGTSWLHMHHTTVTACDEVPSSRGREELAEAAGLSYPMEFFSGGCTSRQAKDAPDLHGLNFNLRHSDLLVPHAEGQLAGGEVRRYAGFRNLGNTCFINATLQVFF